MQNTKSLVELLALSLVVFNDKRHEKVKEVYASEDGNIFIDENRAKIHKVKYHKITRTEAEQSKPKDTGNDVNEEEVAAKTKELQELELTTANYQKMKSLVLFFDIETPDLKAESLISALTDYKSKISN